MGEVPHQAEGVLYDAEHVVVILDPGAGHLQPLVSSS